MLVPLGVLVSLAALYLVLSPRYNHALYRPLLFHPYPYVSGSDMPPSLPNCNPSQIYVRKPDGKKIFAWFFEVPTSKQVILFNHGNAGNLSHRNQVLPLLLQTGASVFIYEYAGFGNSDGLPNLDSICNDALVAYDYLRNELGYESTDIVAYGESLGAAVAAYLTTQRECSALVLQSGFTSLRRIALEIFPFLKAFPTWMFPTRELNTLKIVSSKHPPLLIIHGVLDDVIPYSHAESLYAGASEPKSLVTLPNSGHGDIPITDPSEYLNSIKKLLAQANSQAVVEQKAM